MIPVAGDLIRIAVLVFCGDDHPFRQKQFQHIRHRCKLSARIPPQINDQAAHVLFFQRIQRLFKLVICDFVKFFHPDISDVPFFHLIFDRPRLNNIPYHRYINLFTVSRNAKLHFRSRIARDP